MSPFGKGRSLWRAFNYNPAQGNEGAEMAIARQLMKHSPGCVNAGLGITHVSTPQLGFTRVRVECSACKRQRTFYFQSSRGDGWKRFLAKPW
jgi:hypothetical protein